MLQDSVSHNITLEFSLFGWKIVSMQNLWENEYLNFTGRFGQI